MIKQKCCSGTTFITKRWASQWEDLMRKYSEKNKVTCKFAEGPLSPPANFLTSSTYDGGFDAIGMSGYGEYTFPNGVLYRGLFEDGMFHGNGELVYNDGPEAKSVIRGNWVKGVLTQRKVFFNDNLEYDEHKWKYCEFPDRRYGEEYETNLLPAGMSHITAEVPPRDIPPGLYDTGSGFYNPETKVISDYERPSDVIRAPSLREQKWLQNNCRKEPLGRVGPRPDFYESWSAPVPEPPPLPEPIAGFKRKLNKNPSLYDHFQEDRPAFYEPSSNVNMLRFEKSK